MRSYILYQNYETLGHRVDQGIEEVDLQDQRLIHFGKMMTAGHKEAAIAELHGLLKEYPDDLDIRRRLHQLLVVEQQCDRLGKHSRRYLPQLLKAGQASQAPAQTGPTAGVRPDSLVHRHRRAEGGGVVGHEPGQAQRGVQ